MSGRAAGSTAGRTVPAAPARRSPLSDDAGAVTVEAALALCALTVFLVLALGALVASRRRCAAPTRHANSRGSLLGVSRTAAAPSPAASHRPARDWS